MAEYSPLKGSHVVATAYLWCCGRIFITPERPHSRSHRPLPQHFSSSVSELWPLTFESDPDSVTVNQDAKHWGQRSFRWNVHHHRFTALFPGQPGSSAARRELLDFMVQGKINRLTIGLSSAHLHHPPILLQARCPSCRQTNSVKALKAKFSWNGTFWKHSPSNTQQINCFTWTTKVAGKIWGDTDWMSKIKIKNILTMENCLSTTRKRFITANRNGIA